MKFSPEILTFSDAVCPGYPAQYPPVSVWKRPGNAELAAAWGKTLKRDPGLNLYVNIPFCRQICRFCAVAYRKRKAGEGEVSGYLASLGKEIKSYGGLLPRHRVGSVFLGGGTPSLITAGQLGRLLKELKENFNFKTGAGLGIEVTPDTITAAKLKTLAGCGLDYVSLGVQSLDDAVLARANRSHSAAQAKSAFRRIRALTRAKINVDLMAGLAGQSRVSFLKDVVRVAGWRPDHLHLACYIPADGRGGAAERENFTRWVEAGFEALDRLGYLRTGEFNAEAGAASGKWKSNYFGNGRRSVLGLGHGAFSSGAGFLRAQNETTLAGYTGRAAGELPVGRACFVTLRQEMTAYILSSFEHSGGVEKKPFYAEFRRGLDAEFKKELSELTGRKIALAGAGGYRLAARLDKFRLAEIFYESGVKRGLYALFARAKT